MKRDIAVFAENVTYEQFINDIDLQDMIIRRFEIIGEAVKHIPEDLKVKYPKILWKEISGTRDILIHEYFGVNLERVWETIKKDLLPFKNILGQILKDIDRQIS